VATQTTLTGVARRGANVHADSTNTEQQGGGPVTSTAPIADQDPWLVPPVNAKPPALTERLIRALEAHAAAEAHDVASCQALQERVGDPAFGLLLGLIVQGEQRHQPLLRTMVERLHGEDRAAPAPLHSDPTAVTSLRALIRNQHEGARYVRHLARQEPTLYEGLYATILETMARDSEKHATMLRYLLRRLEDTVV
jgi:hypothetical protein